MSRPPVARVIPTVNVFRALQTGLLLVGLAAASSLAIAAALVRAL